MFSSAKKHPILNAVTRALCCMTVLPVAIPFSALADGTVKIEYGVPEGFGEAEQSSNQQFVAVLNGNPLPGYIFWDNVTGKLGFDEALYATNNVSRADITLLKNTLNGVDYKQCDNGCDTRVGAMRVRLDKVKKSITLTDSDREYVVPDTHLGLVHNQTVDVRASSADYRTVNLSGQGYIGLPLQSYGFFGWYADRNETANHTVQDQGLSTWYLQKNFARYYLRAGRMDSIDYSAGTVSTLIAPSFDRFLTLGSQSNLHDDSQSAGSLVLYANAEGNYEIYRDGRLLMRYPATLGRNEIGFQQLPGGYYTAEVRLVDRNGHIISQETHNINNVNFARHGTSWNLTLGKDAETQSDLLAGAFSRDTGLFLVNASGMKGSEGRWVTEANVSRPGDWWGVAVQPTMGVITGEKSSGTYVQLGLSGEYMGYLNVSRYQNSQVSDYYYGSESTSVSYSHSLGKTNASYNFNQYASGESHQVQLNWGFHPIGTLVQLAVGVQKGGYHQGGGNYGLFMSTTLMLADSHASINMARSGNQTRVSANYQRDMSDEYGTTTLGSSLSHAGDRNDVNLFAARTSSRGDVTVNAGTDGTVHNGSINYRGMVAVDAQGIAAGRYSNSGSALLLEVPGQKGINYGFDVNGNPVHNNGTFAVPVNRYQDITFAQVGSRSQDTDMNIEVPANIVRAHPGQVYHAKANVDINMMYNGFLRDENGKPVAGQLEETGDRVYPNGLFSVASKEVLRDVHVASQNQRYSCDLTNKVKNDYLCHLI